MFLNSAFSLRLTSSILFVEREGILLQRGQIFQIDQVNAGVLPPLFTLIDLMKDKVAGHYYFEQLTRAPTPNYQTDFFLVEKVLGEKTVRGEKYYLVKFLYYPSKFNQFIPAANFKKGHGPKGST